MAWKKQHSKNKSCNESTIVTNRSGKTRWRFGRRPFALLCSLVFFWVGSSSVRAELTETQVTAAVVSGIMQAFTTAPLSFGGNGQNVVPWVWPDLNGLTLGEYLSYASGFSVTTNPDKTLRSILEDIQSAIESNPSLSSEDLENLFDQFFTSQNVSIGNLARPQYEFFRDLMLQGDDVGYKVYSFFEARPDWLDFFEAVYDASLKTYDFGMEYPRLIDTLGYDEDAWRAVLATETVDAFEI